METDEKFEAEKIAETIVSWYNAIKVDLEDRENFMILLKVAITNPTFHMEISEEAGKLNYEKLEDFIRGDIEGIEQLMKDKSKYFNKALHGEVTKFKSYLGEYIESISKGETAEFEEKEQKIRSVAEEYSAIIDELSAE
ncbi:hypothetical protein MSMTP_2945 [Methanosarcina sp. MTP4]|uniref:hypothetical protein n=1 Tax=Methanosarcina sp. MTP4 TaxID=1434100 RepID=UPI000615B0B9|nr:hypothetical protein [Methanosarcina sp. MTP4]AKB26414.1 hypothetical protein MSMTP_2945 [Methanosarcina sp. MTP4]